MSLAALWLYGCVTFGPPVLPSEPGDLPPDVDQAEDVEPPAEPEPEPEPEPPGVEPEPEPSPEEDAIAVTPPDEPAPEDDDDDDDGAGAGAGAAAAGAGAGAGAAGGAAVQRPSSSAPVQQPKSATPAKGASGQSSASSTSPQPAKTEGPATEPEAAESEPEPEATDDKKDEKDEPVKKLGGFRLFRVGIAAKIGYMHGTSAKNGLYDRDKSIQDSINSGMVMMSGAGDLGTTKFGGPMFGFILDAEVVGINVWLDFNKFFRPGGNWAVLLGYDHEFGFGKRLRLDVGVAGGLHKAFLGNALSNLYYDKNNPAAVNIGTLGVEGRAMVDLHIKLVGPLFTGPSLMLGYHYLWSANVAEVTAEKGLHYSAAWTLRVDFAAPKRG